MSEAEGYTPHIEADYHAELVGQAVVTMVFVEHCLIELITALIGPEKSIGLAVVAGESFSTMMRTAKRLVSVRILDPQAKTEVSAWLKRAAQAQEKRNRLAHSLWVREGPIDSDLAPAQRLVIAAQEGNFDWELDHLPPTEVEEIAIWISETVNAFSDLQKFLAIEMPEVGQRIEPFASVEELEQSEE